MDDKLEISLLYNTVSLTLTGGSSNDSEDLDVLGRFVDETELLSDILCGSEL